MKYKSENIGTLGLGAPGWLDDAIHRKNYVSISVETAERDDYGRYLERQSDEVIELFLERMKNKCKNCRPTCGCSSCLWNYNVASIMKMVIVIRPFMALIIPTAI